MTENPPGILSMVNVNVESTSISLKLASSSIFRSMALFVFAITSSTGRILYECEPDNLKMYKDQLRYFIRCIRRKEEPENDLEYALHTLKIGLGG